jgi:hypothetical protein
MDNLLNRLQYTVQNKTKPPPLKKVHKKVDISEGNEAGEIFVK